MNETEPQYFTQFKTSTNDSIKNLENSMRSVEKTVNDLAIMIKDNVAMKSDLENLATKDEIEELRNIMATKDDIKDMATKEDVREAVAPVLKLIGSYEVRAKNVEDILLQDHKPRIANLEKEVFV